MPSPKPKTEPLPLGGGYKLRKKNGKEFSVELLQKYRLRDGRRIAIIQISKKADRPALG